MGIKIKNFSHNVTSMFRVPPYHPITNSLLDISSVNSIPLLNSSCKNCSLKTKKNETNTVLNNMTVLPSTSENPRNRKNIDNMVLNNLKNNLSPYPAKLSVLEEDLSKSNILFQANGRSDRRSSCADDEIEDDLKKSTNGHRLNLEALNCSWFRPDLTREQTLDFLDARPVGTFVVRQSASRSGSYALSVRVPKRLCSDGVAHYLVVRTDGEQGSGYKIKGFAKVFQSLVSLITHHSVMREGLLWPLSLGEHGNQSSKCSINSSLSNFANVDMDPDYPELIVKLKKSMAQPLS